jgi:hypothetical protein
MTTETQEQPKRNRWLLVIAVAVLTVMIVAIAALAVQLTAANASAAQANASASQTRSQLAGISKQLGQLKARDAAPKAAANSADAAHLGVCWVSPTSDSTGYVTSGGYVFSPQNINGVVTCPQGTFIPVAPQSVDGSVGNGQ